MNILHSLMNIDPVLVRTFAAVLILHFFVDFTLQGLLGKLKQKAWWKEQVKELMGKELKDTRYKYDYLMGLFVHSLYWSLVTFLPFFYTKWYGLVVVVNTVIHFVIDDFKANRFKLNLIQDQLLHFVQIAATVLFLYNS